MNTESPNFPFPTKFIKQFSLKNYNHLMLQTGQLIIFGADFQLCCVKMGFLLILSLTQLAQGTLILE